MKSYLASKSSLTFEEQWIAKLLSQVVPQSLSPLVPNGRGRVRAAAAERADVAQRRRDLLGRRHPSRVSLGRYRGDDGVQQQRGARGPHTEDDRQGDAGEHADVRVGVGEWVRDRDGPVTVLHGEKRSEEYAVVETPAEEFMIEVITVKKGERFTIPVIPVPRVLIWYQGRGVVEESRYQWVREGTVRGRRGAILFQAAGDERTIVAEEDVVVYATHEKCLSVCW